MTEKKVNGNPRQPDAEAADRPILRFLTCGSVDDGKSTLIGRLLYDSELIADDTVASLEKDSRTYGTAGGATDFALLVDACKRNASKALPSTSPTAISRRSNASSLSPTRRATNNTPATWQRARRAPTLP